MDVKGGSWVGDIYQKFEAMCFEAEEVIYEDTFKYVENQVRIVGDSVKKFYSDVMQDLLPPSSLDSVKAKDPLSGHAAEANIYTETKQLVKDSLSQVTNLALSDRNISKEEDMECIKDSRESLSNSSSMSDNIPEYHGEDTTLEPCISSENSTPVHDDTSSKEVPEVSHSEDDGPGIHRDLIGCDGGGAIVEVKKIEILSGGDLTNDLDRHFPTDSGLTSMKADSNTMITSNVENTMEVDKELSMFDIGTSSSFLAPEFRLCEGNEEGFLVGQPNEVKLEESCILVGKTDIFSKSGVHVQRSYKKRIQDVFFTRRWTKGKRNQDQLAAWYEEQCGKSQTNESFETDWELL